MVKKSERVAQTVEHVTFNHGVLGSIPSALTKITNAAKIGFSPLAPLPGFGRHRLGRTCNRGHRDRPQADQLGGTHAR